MKEKLVTFYECEYCDEISEVKEEMAEHEEFCDYRNKKAKGNKDMNQQERNQKLKADAGKLRMELIPPSAIEAIAEVMTFGASKYGANKWQQVDKDRYIGALLRHLTAYMKNPKGKDSESGISHIKHLLCNAAFLVALEEDDPLGLKLSLCNVDKENPIAEIFMAKATQYEKTCYECESYGYDPSHCKISKKYDPNFTTEKAKNCKNYKKR